MWLEIMFNYHLENNRCWCQALVWRSHERKALALKASWDLQPLSLHVLSLSPKRRASGCHHLPLFRGGAVSMKRALLHPGGHHPAEEKRLPLWTQQLARAAAPGRGPWQRCCSSIPRCTFLPLWSQDASYGRCHAAVLEAAFLSLSSSI